jgi:hypothetical protein
MYQVNRVKHLIKQGAQQNNYWAAYANALTDQQNPQIFLNKNINKC